MEVHAPPADVRALHSERLEVVGLWVLAACLLLVLAFWIFAHPGPTGTDDIHYAEIGHALTQGRAVLTETPFFHRLGLVVPVALTFSLLGVGTKVATLPSLLAVLGLLAVSARFAWRIAGPVAGAATVTLLATNTGVLRLSAELYPDGVMAFWALFGAYCVWEARKSTSAPSRFAWAAALFFMGFLVKELVAPLVPWLVALIALDLRDRKHVHGWLAFCAVSAGMLGSYLLAYYVASGDALLRFHVVEAAHNRPHAEIMQHTGQLPHRLLVEPVQRLLGRTSWLIAAALAAPAVLAVFERARLPLRGGRALPSLVLILAFYLSYGSSSLGAYVPVLITPRNLTLLLGATAVLAGVTVASLSDPRSDVEAKRRMLRYSLAVMGAGLITQALADGRTQLPFSLLFTGLLAFTYRELGTTREGTPRPVALPAVGILLVNLGYLASAWALNRDVFQPDGPMNAHQRLAALLAPTARPTRIYAEKHAQQTMAMLLGFPDRRQASFQALPRDGAIALAPGTRQMVYLRLDDYAGAHTNFGTPVPAFVDNPPRGWKEVAKFDPFAALYEVQPASSSGVASRQSASGPP